MPHAPMSESVQGAAAAVDAQWAFARYESIRHRLPQATFPASSRTGQDLSDVAHLYDGFVLDAFGVLNVGNSPIAGAIDRMAELRRAGKKLVVLTNAASYTRSAALEKYGKLGFDFSANEVVSSRDVAVDHLDRIAPGARWAAISTGQDNLSDLPAGTIDLVDHPQALDQADGLILLSSLRWSEDLQERLFSSLTRRPRPVVVANPDIVAPREDGLSLEPGLFAHELADRVAIPVHWFGKPFGDGFAEARRRLGDMPANRLAMVGDTLHTDVLGGCAAGMGTILITAHGLFAGHDVNTYIEASGIRPDCIVETT